MSTILWAFEAGAKRKGYAAEYLDMAGDLVTGILLNQIIFWWSPTEEGKSKLRVYKPQTGWWLAKSKKDWAKEVRITERQYDTAIKKLVERDLITHPLYKFNGTPTERHSTRAVVYRHVSESHRNRRHAVPPSVGTLKDVAFFSR
jgi:hypothetical protein